MADPMRLNGRVALITGAASGIGRATALSLARRGCRLALADLDPVGLEETVGLISTPDLSVSRHRLDVADAPAVAALPALVKAAHGRLDLLVNNAGVALGGTFEQVSDADFEWLFGINFGGVMRMTRAFLPMLHASDDARIVNLSSVFGLIAPPGQVAYCASKFAVRGFSESLRHELAGSRIGVTTVHPGGVATNIAANARFASTVDPDDAERGKRRFAKALRLPPAVAGEHIVRAVEQRKARVVIGVDAKIATAMERLFPTVHWNVLARLAKRLS